MSDVKEVLRLAQPPIKNFAPGVIFGIFSAGAAVSLLAVSAWLITRAADMPPIMYLNMAIVGVRFFALARASFKYAERLSGHDAALRSLATLRVAIYRRLVPLAPDGLGNTRRGDLLARLVSDVDQLQDLPLRVITPLVVSGVVGLGSVFTVWAILPAAGFALLVALIVATVIGTLLQSWLSAQADKSISRAKAGLDDNVMDLVSRLDVLTAFGAISQRMDSVLNADSAVRLIQLKRAYSSGAVAALVAFISGLATVAALVLGVPELVFPANTAETPGLGWGIFSGPYLAIVVLVPMAVFEVFQNVPQAFSVWRTVRASASRIATVTPESIPVEIPHDCDEQSDLAIEKFDSLVLDHVYATWPGETERALKPLSLSIKPGECVLIEGPSGSGKTTLAHVLVRFLEYQGTYQINGIDAQAMPVHTVRNIVGLVEQNPHMFTQSIRQNLLFAQPHARDEVLIDVLKRVGLDEWVAQRGGLDAQVGERGALVSGGQAQRIALARALLYDFPVLILDEPTANVDPGQADQLMRDVLTLGRTQNRAVIVISHVPAPSDLVTQRIVLG